MGTFTSIIDGIDPSEMKLLGQSSKDDWICDKVLIKLEYLYIVFKLKDVDITKTNSVSDPLKYYTKTDYIIINQLF